MDPDDHHLLVFTPTHCVRLGLTEWFLGDLVIKGLWPLSWALPLLLSSCSFTLGEVSYHVVRQLSAEVHVARDPASQSHETAGKQTAPRPQGQPSEETTAPVTP